MADLDNLIRAIECENYHETVCEHCPYGYQYLDDSGDRPMWWHDDEKVLNDALVYLKALKGARDTLGKRKEELRGVYGDLGGACSGAFKLLEPQEE